MEGNVHVSQDEGKSWARADGIPEGKAAMVIEHPFDNSYVRTLLTTENIFSPYTTHKAFVLTKDYVHYRTEDRGKTWRSFEMPVRPARVGRPLSFHSDPKKYGYILYQGTVCEHTTPWGSVCHDEVRTSYLSATRKITDAPHRIDILHQGCI